jgi:hypothetical protein
MTMDTVEDPFQPIVIEDVPGDLDLLKRKPANLSTAPLMPYHGAVIGRLHGFDLDDCPLVSGLETSPGQVIAARTTVSLRREMIGAPIVILYEAGNPHLPIIIGVIQQSNSASQMQTAPSTVAVQADDERYVLEAEREIVLRCGDASITLTRAGKVIIKGNYILSRSTGYNKIKGAAVDIN